MSDGDEVVFRRGEETEGDDNIWDDSALIEAYDRAVNTVKERIENGNTARPVYGILGNDVHGATKKKKQQRPRHGNVTSSAVRVQVGDRCQAVFSEDGQWYDAEVIAVDSSAMTCTVRYIGYGNEEVQQICDIALSDSGPMAPQDSDRDDEVRLPSIPPPPPLLGDSEDDSHESSALSSMLIAWYMSGYHTGYYQGLKDGKKQSLSKSQQHPHN